NISILSFFAFLSVPKLLDLLLITTVSKVSVEAGKSISIPCLYESQYIDHVKYLCEGHIWSSCRSSGSIDGTTVTTHMRDPDVSTVTMTGLRSEDSGWYWCSEGDIQIPVYLNVTEKPIKSEYCKLSKILHVNEFNTFINICTLGL
uniref:Ig-like domain-containing protein n=1 Tax=Pundamilia nyererei TaxID=303518 RepID=A0A3B4FVK0_9CICH